MIIDRLPHPNLQYSNDRLECRLPTLPLFDIRHANDITDFLSGEYLMFKLLNPGMVRFAAGNNVYVSG